MLNYTSQCKSRDKSVLLHHVIHFYTSFIAYYAERTLYILYYYTYMHIHYYILL